MTPVRLEPAALRSQVKHYTTEPSLAPVRLCICTGSHDPLLPADANEPAQFKVRLILKSHVVYVR